MSAFKCPLFYFFRNIATWSKLDLAQFLLDLQHPVSSKLFQKLWLVCSKQDNHSFKKVHLGMVSFKNLFFRDQGLVHFWCEFKCQRHFRFYYVNFRCDKRSFQGCHSKALTSVIFNELYVTTQVEFSHSMFISIFDAIYQLSLSW